MLASDKVMKSSYCRPDMHAPITPGKTNVNACLPTGDSLLNLAIVNMYDEAARTLITGKLS